MLIPIQSERVRGVDVTPNFYTIHWYDGTVGVLSRKEAEAVARALIFGDPWVEGLMTGDVRYFEGPR